VVIFFDSTNCLEWNNVSKTPIFKPLHAVRLALSLFLF
jgi:hypothetical protein